MAKKEKTKVKTEAEAVEEAGTEEVTGQAAEETPAAEPEKAAETPGEETSEKTGEDVTEEEKPASGKKEKQDPRDAKIEELNDKLMRQMAEFDNYRKRTEKEKASMYEVGAREVLEKLLPIVDNFERGLADADESDPFADGILKIYKQLVTTLEEIGVKPIESVGCEFDPNLHNAVMHEESEDAGTNIITEEFQKGYTYRDSVIRYSMVKVAN